MENAIQEACVAATNLLDEYARVEIASARYAEKEPHPGGQEAFVVRAHFPWQRRPATRVMIGNVVGRESDQTTTGTKGDS